MQNKTEGRYHWILPIGTNRDQREREREREYKKNRGGLMLVWKICILDYETSKFQEPTNIHKK